MQVDYVSKNLKYSRNKYRKVYNPFTGSVVHKTSVPFLRVKSVIVPL